MRSMPTGPLGHSPVRTQFPASNRIERIDRDGPVGVLGPFLQSPVHLVVQRTLHSFEVVYRRRPTKAGITASILFVVRCGQRPSIPQQWCGHPRLLTRIVRAAADENDPARSSPGAAPSGLPEGNGRGG